MTRGEKILMERTLLSATDKEGEVGDAHILEIWVRRSALLQQCNLNDENFSRCSRSYTRICFYMHFYLNKENYNTVLEEMSTKLQVLP